MDTGRTTLRFALLLPLALAGCMDRDTITGVTAAGPMFSQLPASPVVNTLLDDGTGCTEAKCTIRDAIEFAEPGAEITFSVAGTIALDPAKGSLAIGKDLTITGPGADVLTIARTIGAAQPHFRIIAIQSADVSISGIAVTGGYDFSGGGIQVNQGTLQLTRSWIHGNRATGSGGGLYHGHGALMVSHSTVSGNTAKSGGGIFTNGLTLELPGATIVNSTITSNEAEIHGGGIYNWDGNAWILHNTITGNRAGESGGGLFSWGDVWTRTRVQSSIIVGNTLADGITSDDVGLMLSFPINRHESLGYNLVGTAGKSVDFDLEFNQPTDQTGVTDAKLGPLQDNGGSTPTRALLDGSPATDAIPVEECRDFEGQPVTTDQRNFPRPQPLGGSCDIGAFEVGSPFLYDFTGFFAPVLNPPTLNTVNAGQAIPVRFQLGGDYGLDIFAPGYPRAEAFNCGSSTLTGEVSETVTAGQSSLSYSTSTETYTYVWKTERAWRNTCRELVLRFDDGTTRSALFQFH
jgi:predicted outer membrane repeat protein